MAKIEMDVTEYDALRNNIKLLEESKKVESELHKVIDKMKEENLQTLRDVQQKVLTQVQTTVTEHSNPIFGGLEFDKFVDSVSGFVSHHGRSSIDQRCDRCGERDSFRNHSCMRCGQPMSAFRGHSAQDHNSVRQWVENQARHLFGTPLKTSTSHTSPPVYVGLSEVKKDIEKQVIADLDRKTKDLLLLEKEFTTFKLDKKELNSIITTLQREKMKLAEDLEKIRQKCEESSQENNRLTKKLMLYKRFRLTVRGALDSSYVFAHYLKKEILGHEKDSFSDRNDLG